MANHLVRSAVTFGRYRWLLLAAALACAGGCQSGRIENIQSSSDAQVLAFRDPRYQQIYVADGRGVRSVCNGYGPYVLSPDGQWLLYLGGQSETGREGILERGTVITLHDLAKHCRHPTNLPVCVPDPRDWRRREQDSSAPANDAGAANAQPDSPQLFFGSSRLAIGPVQGEYWVWNFHESGRAAWRPLSPEDAERELATLSLPVPVFAREDWKSSRDYIVELQTDGVTALRTVWVRPDGSVLELVRKNDVPARLALACAASVFSPLAMFGHYHSESIGMNILCGLQMTVWVAVCPWRTAFEDLEVEDIMVRRAPVILQERIERRLQAPTVSLPTTSQPRPVVP